MRSLKSLENKGNHILALERYSLFVNIVQILLCLLKGDLFLKHTTEMSAALLSMHR